MTTTLIFIPGYSNLEKGSTRSSALKKLLYCQEYFDWVHVSQVQPIRLVHVVNRKTTKILICPRCRTNICINCRAPIKENVDKNLDHVCIWKEKQHLNTIRFQEFNIRKTSFKISRLIGVSIDEVIKGTSNGTKSEAKVLAFWDRVVVVLGGQGVLQNDRFFIIHERWFYFLTNKVNLRASTILQLNSSIRYLR
jgi:hypothetical protein